jgi:hypothetical protein
MQGEVPDPQAAKTFRHAKLAWQWPDGSPQAGLRRLYAALLAARRQWPALADREHTFARHPVGTRPGEDILVLERGGTEGILAIANCSAQPCVATGIAVGRRTLLLSTAAKRFGGPRADDDPLVPLLPYEMQLFGAG